MDKSVDKIDFPLLWTKRVPAQILTRECRFPINGTLKIWSTFPNKNVKKEKGIIVLLFKVKRKERWKKIKTSKEVITILFIVEHYESVVNVAMLQYGSAISAPNWLAQSHFSFRYLSAFNLTFFPIWRFHW